MPRTLQDLMRDLRFLTAGSQKSTYALLRACVSNNNEDRIYTLDRSAEVSSYMLRDYSDFFWVPAGPMSSASAALPRRR